MCVRHFSSHSCAQVFDGYRIKTALAGLIMVGVANGLTIIFLGLYSDSKAEQHQHNDAVVHVGNGSPVKSNV